MHDCTGKCRGLTSAHKSITEQNTHRFIFRSLEGCQAILMSNTGLQKVEEGNLEETTVAVWKILTPPVNWSKFQTSGPHPTGDGVYEGSRCKQFTWRPVQNLTHVLSKLGHNCVQKYSHCQDRGFNLSSLVTG